MLSEQVITQWWRLVGFYESHGPPPVGNARGIVPTHRHGHQNGQQSEYVLHNCVDDCCPGGRQGDVEWSKQSPDGSLQWLPE